nr:hypothetical protein [Sicyoidochytrium minutum DNA virus]
MFLFLLFGFFRETIRFC